MVTTVEITQTIIFSSSVFDEIEELSYLKRYQNVFHSEISEFAATELLGKLINETFENKVAALDQNDEFFDERKIELDGVFSMKFSKKKCHRKNTIRETDEKIKKAEKDPKTKTIVEFNSRLACSIKCLDVKQNNTAKPTTRFFSGKMLMIDKISLIGFIHDLIETFCFPNNRTKKNLRKISNSVYSPLSYSYRYRQYFDVFYFRLQTRKLYSR